MKINHSKLENDLEVLYKGVKILSKDFRDMTLHKNQEKSSYKDLCPISLSLPFACF